jgi:hypothetical protein
VRKTDRSEINKTVCLRERGRERERKRERERDKEGEREREGEIFGGRESDLVKVLMVKESEGRKGEREKKKKKEEKRKEKKKKAER